MKKNKNSPDGKCDRKETSLKRQNSATLRKYGCVYESIQKNMDKLEIKDEKAKKEVKKIKDEPRKEKPRKGGENSPKEKPRKDKKRDPPKDEGGEKSPKEKPRKDKKRDPQKDAPRKPLNSYQLFFKEKRLAGKSPKEIGALWKTKKLE